MVCKKEANINDNCNCDCHYCFNSLCELSKEEEKENNNNNYYIDEENVRHDFIYDERLGYSVEWLS